LIENGKYFLALVLTILREIKSINPYKNMKQEVYKHKAFNTLVDNFISNKLFVEQVN